MTRIILILSIFSIIETTTIEVLIYSTQANSVRTKGNQTQAYGVDFPEKDKIPSYVKIEVISEDENAAPLLCFSKDDYMCHSREQLAKNPNGKNAVIWARREEFNYDENGLFFYAYIQCEKESCLYNLTITGDYCISFKPNFIYSYSVTSFSKQMDFEIRGTEVNTYMTIALEGSSNANLVVEDISDNEIRFRNGQALTFFLENTQGIINERILARITVKNAAIDEYLTLSIHLVDIDIPLEGYSSDINLILPNGPEITSYLKKDVINMECFPLDLSNSKYNSMNQLYITGRIHTKYAFFFLEDEKRNFLTETDTKILDGQLSYVIKNNNKMNYLCFELINEDTISQSQMAFSFSVTNPKNLSNLYNYYPPQMTGEIYRRIIPKGFIAFFSGTKNDNNAEKYDYNLYQRKGLTKMYIGDCKKYPDCHYDIKELDNLIKVNSINQMSIWTTNDDKSSTIGSEKYVIVAFCEDDVNEENEYCEFETSIFSKSQDIYLVEEEKFSKYLIEGEKGRFIIDLNEGRTIQRLTVDIMLFGGDVTFNYDNSNLKEEDIITCDKYYLSNKLFMHFKFNQINADKIIIIEYSAEINSFFNIQYGVHSYNIDQLEEKVPSGESYLVQIDPYLPSKFKDVYLLHQFYQNQNLFLTNFLELNCDFKVKRNDKSINCTGGYGQEILNKNTEGYDSEYYLYHIIISDADLSNYNHKMCMLYISGYEAETKYDREIVIAENVNQKIIFKENIKKIRYLYPHSDLDKDVTVHVNVIDKALYKINIFVNGNCTKEEKISNTQIIYLNSEIINDICYQNALCPIIVEIIYDQQITKEDPMLEITVRPIGGAPTYLQKGKLKLDFASDGNIYYLYTDIGKNENAEVTVNFLRQSKNRVLGKIVSKYQSYIDEEANWRGIYRLPSYDWEDSIYIDEYTKKLLITNDYTSDCINGCYLLISIELTDNNAYYAEDIFYPFSIITKITPSQMAYTDSPKIKIQSDEIILGNVEISTNERIFEFFEIWLPIDSNTVEFDWQSSVAGLYINVGGTRPTTKNADFKLLPPGRDTILSITKDEILNVVENKKMKIPNKNSLEDLNLVIGIWTNKTDSIDTELYSFRVHQPPLSTKDLLDINLVNTNQKILCNPEKIDTDKYRCLFVVTYSDKDTEIKTPLFIYGASTNQEALYDMFASFIDKDIYHQYIGDDLKSRIPTEENSDFETKTSGAEYFYINSLEKGKYMFISIIANKPDPIMILTFMQIINYIKDDQLTYNINSKGEQLLYVPDEKLILDFRVINSVIVDIVALNGHAEISWNNDPDKVFILKGSQDRISLSSGKSKDKLIIRRLFNNDKNYSNKLTSEIDQEFVFYIKYRKKDPNVNYNEIEYGKSIEISYKETELPLYLYSKIGDCNYDINVAITFKDLDLNKKGQYFYSPLNLMGAIVSENTLYKMKDDPELNPSIEEIIIGINDPAINTAQIYFSKSTIDKYKVKKEDNPTLYLSIQKSGSFIEQDNKYFSIEAQIYLINSGILLVENIYHYFKYSESPMNLYRLKINKNKAFMALELSFSNNNLDFAIGETMSSQNNSTELIINWVQGKGKIILIIKADEFEFIYLNIFKKYNYTSDLSVYNYALKYYFMETEKDIIDYKILNNNNELIIGNKTEDNEITIECTFNKIDLDKAKSNITYFMKIIDDKTYYKNESYESIALMESPHYTFYEKNPVDHNGRITLEGTNVQANIVYIQVIALIEKDNNSEYISYKGIKFIIKENDPEPEEEEEEEEKEEKGEKEEEEEEAEENEGEEEEKEEEKENNNGNKQPINNNKEKVYIVLLSIMSFIIVVLLLIIIIHCIRKKNIENKIEINKDEGLLPEKQMK